ncbi:threonine/serine exporter family protein [Lutispora thermophila]|uniref:Uncharacterized membrane protein YjjB, DUF3815 family n=1 Tax=Lutispora thermophila DSM 19022 TaxID=1122184 RepID=A0A1M6FUT7_9FIRM|nr:threonine/serine exporter family protein [Lutispora thermophila]SHJ01458.1 Uncharacterized membrane protein YjjB, DUF3815 family [Lutispora thermophila DSM 19022]
MKGIILAFLGSFCPALLFNIEKNKLIWAGICGATGWTVYNSIYSYSGNKIYAAFIASVVISLISEIMAKLLKTPATVFNVPSLFPIVPGVSAYYTILYIIENDLTAAAYKGIETLGIAGAIAFGIILVSTIFRYINTRKRRKAI